MSFTDTVQPAAAENVPLAALQALAGITLGSRSSAARTGSRPATDPGASNLPTPRVQIVDNSMDFESLAELKRVLRGCLIL